MQTTRILSQWTLAGLLLLSAPSAHAQFTYATNNGSITLYNYTGPGGDVTISNFVTAIGTYAFEYSHTLTDIVIPNSVTSIGPYSFNGCSALTNVSIPNSVTSIGTFSFSGCIVVAGVNIPSSVTNIGAYAFLGCSALLAIQVDPQNSFYISVDGALLDKSATTLITCPPGFSGSYTIPATVNVVGDNAFLSCTQLTSILLPISVTNIGAQALAHYSALTAITVDPQNPAFSSIDGVLFDKTATTLLAYPGGLPGNYTLPPSVSIIGSNSFAGNSGLTAITIPNGVSTIADNAFSSCPGLTGVTIPDSVINIGKAAFSSCAALTNLVLGAGVTNLGDTAFSACRALLSVVIPDGVTRIGRDAFSHCSTLNSITIPDSVTHLGDYAFEDCLNLKSAVIGSGVTAIEGQVFDFCRGLTNIVIGPNVTSLGIEAFKDCTNLTSVSIPNSVTNIAYYAFDGCSSLTNIVLGSGVARLANYSDHPAYPNFPFSGCTALRSFVVDPQNLNFSSLNGVLFDRSAETLLTCPQGLTGSYTIPAMVTNIGSYAFAPCSRLTNLVVGAGVSRIGDFAFDRCSALQAFLVDLQNPFYTSANGILFNKDRTTLVAYPESLTGAYTVPDTITTIANGAFADCSGLTSLTIPSTVNTLGYFAFGSCSSLSKVYFKGDAPLDSDYVFSQGQKLITIYYLPGTAGWSNTFHDIYDFPAVPWTLPNPVVLDHHSTFGFRTNRFGFTVSWATNRFVVVEAATNLFHPIWKPLQTNTLPGGSSYFSDPAWSSNRSRFYRIRAQ